MLARNHTSHTKNRNAQGKPECICDLFTTMIENGVIDWDCAGLSHYYGWHELEIKEAAREVLRLRRTNKQKCHDSRNHMALDEHKPRFSKQHRRRWLHGLSNESGRPKEMAGRIIQCNSISGCNRCDILGAGMAFQRLSYKMGPRLTLR